MNESIIELMAAVVNRFRSTPRTIEWLTIILVVVGSSRSSNILQLIETLI